MIYHLLFAAEVVALLALGATVAWYFKRSSVHVVQLGGVASPLVGGVCATCGGPVHEHPPFGINVEVWNAHGQQMSRWNVYNGGEPIPDALRLSLIKAMEAAVHTWLRENVTNG